MLRNSRKNDDKLNLREQEAINDLMCMCNTKSFRKRGGLHDLQKQYDNSRYLHDIYGAWVKLHHDKNSELNKYIEKIPSITKYTKSSVINKIIPIFYDFFNSSTEEQKNEFKQKIGLNSFENIAVTAGREANNAIERIQIPREDRVIELGSPVTEIEADQHPYVENDENQYTFDLAAGKGFEILIETLYKCIFAVYLNGIFILYELPIQEQKERLESFELSENFLLNSKIKFSLQYIIKSLEFIFYCYYKCIKFFSERGPFPRIVTEILLVYLTLLNIPGGKLILHIIISFFNCLLHTNIEEQLYILKETIINKAIQVGWNITDFLFTIKFFVENMNRLAPVIEKLAPTIENIAPAVETAVTQISTAAAGASLQIADSASAAGGQISTALMGASAEIKLALVGGAAAAFSGFEEKLLNNMCGIPNGWGNNFISNHDEIKRLLTEIQKKINELHDDNEKQEAIIEMLIKNNIIEDRSMYEQLINSGYHVFKKIGISALMNVPDFVQKVIHPSPQHQRAILERGGKRLTHKYKKNRKSKMKSRRVNKKSNKKYSK
jgi:hypothetical protein